MLPLDSDRWAGLAQAYGGAADVPQMLRDLALDPSDGVWERLWSSLCHQGEVYPASYAAVPHIVRIAVELPVKEQTPYWVFVGSIARGSLDWTRRPTEELKPDFDAALARAGPAILQVLKGRPGDELETLYLLEALAAIRGCGALMDVLEGVRNEEIPTHCPGCEEALYVQVYDDGDLLVTPKSPGGHPDPDRTAVEGGAAREPSKDIRLDDIRSAGWPNRRANRRLPTVSVDSTGRRPARRAGTSSR